MSVGEAVKLGAALLVAAGLAVGCAGGDSTSGDGPPGADGSATTVQASPPGSDDSPAATGDAEPAYDIEAVLARDPLVIFNAYPPKPDHITYELPFGQPDFFELWEPDAPWQTALEHVDVYRLHAFQMRHYLDDDQLVELIEFLREHEIPLMFETEPLLPVDPAECEHSESFEAPWDLEMAVRLKELGGHIDVIAIEQPYHFAHLLDTPGACRYTVDRILDEVLAHVSNLRDLFGDIPVGTIEGVWTVTEPRDMEIWLDSFQARAGEPFAFLHLDPDWTRPDLSEVVRGIEAVADARGVPFGILYNGGLERDNVAWMNAMMDHAAELEVRNGVTPQHVSFQTWVNWPDRALPEDDLGALTSGVVRYVGQRIELTIEPTAEGLVVRALDLDGRGVPGVVLRASGTSNGPTTGSQSISGQVPAGVTEALVLVRANVENATPGTAAATLLDVSFTTDAGIDLVPNGAFDAGTTSWGVYGSHPDGVAPATVASDRGLGVRAAADQTILIDGDRFPVIAGTSYDFSVAYQLEAGASADAVVVAVELVGNSRVSLYLGPVPVDLGELVTGPDGEAFIPSAALGDDMVAVEVSTPGSLVHWPARATLALG